MTIKELIQLLQELPEDIQEYEAWTGGYEGVEIRDLEIDDDPDSQTSFIPSGRGKRVCIGGF